MTCKNHYMTLKMALTAHNALRDHVAFRALYTTLPVKVRHLMGKWGHYRRKVKFNLIIIIFGQVRRAGLKSPTGRIRPGGRTLPMSVISSSSPVHIARDLKIDKCMVNGQYKGPVVLVKSFSS